MIFISYQIVQMRLNPEASPEAYPEASGLSNPEANPEAKHYVELVGKFDQEDKETHKRPRVRCDTEILSRHVAEKINLALDMFEELTQAVINNDADQ